MSPPQDNDEFPVPPDMSHRHGWEPISVKTAWRFLANLFNTLLYLRGVFILLLLFMASGAAVICLVEDVRLFDSVYFVSITALTIGYGDIVPVTLTGKIVSILLGLIGHVIVGILVGASVRALLFTLRMQQD